MSFRLDSQALIKPIRHHHEPTRHETVGVPLNLPPQQTHVH
ncbi:hypothetical protein RSSM_02100 [Rhodopirellula sallentina SM41]|uniref:Uncharacterized protein n=1 Tax=Rhodopirellula sallentina SM41 TaxID=1263870 RepID=M5UF29_9BACT|nr:hypothetical protein RSSM_02100 [Rhodopirellula sallentina SM41]